MEYFENTSTDSSIPAFSLSTESFDLSGGAASKPVILDIDGDGLLEAVVGNEIGELLYFESNISSNGPNCSQDEVTFGNGELSSGTFSAKQTLTAATSIETGSDVEFIAKDLITLTTNFHAKSGATFTARLDDCTMEAIQDMPQEELALATTVTSSTIEMTLYPNPTNSETMIEFNIVEAVNASLEVYSATGKLVQQFFVNQRLDKGLHTQRLSTEQFESGMYIVLLRTDAGIVTEKLSVIK